MSRLFAKTLSLVLLLAGGAVMLLPFAWMISISLKPRSEIFRPNVRFMPEAPTLSNYVVALTELDVPLYLLNGVIVTLGILLLQIAVTVPCAFALAHRDFRGRNLLFGAIVAALLVPFHVTAIPIFLGFSEIGMLNSYAALIVPFVATAFGLFLYRQTFMRLPAELIDAARLDGMSEMGVAWRVAFALSWPTTIAFSIFSVTAHWNDLFWPLIAVTSPDLATPPRGVLYFRDQEAGDNIGPLMAGAALITAPLVLAFLLAQRRFTEGLAATGMKA